MSRKSREELRRIRHNRVRKTVTGTSERPRLNVYRSSEHIYAQVIDDSQGHTLASASTLDPEVKTHIQDLTKAEAAKVVGQLVAKRAKDAGIQQVVFDRGGYQYHGRVQAVADGAREAGLEF